MRQGGLPLLPGEILKFTIYVAEEVGQNQFDILFVYETGPNELSQIMDDLPEQTYMYMSVTDTDGFVSPLSQEWSFDCVVGELVD